MWGLFLFILIIVLVFLEEKCLVDYRFRISDGKIIAKSLFRKKFIEINTVSAVRIITRGAYVVNSIQIKAENKWQSIGRITFFNYKYYINTIGKIIENKPNVAVMSKDISKEIENYGVSSILSIFLVILIGGVLLSIAIFG